jgi:hypothetical protein
MNYLKVYCNLIRKAENRTPPEGYTEKHHTFPKSIFGNNNRIVVLTAREHYVAHLLLRKIFIKRYGLKNWKTIKMINALWWMSNNTHKYCNSNLYEKLRIDISKMYIGENNPSKRDDIREKLRNSTLSLGENHPMKNKETKRKWKESRCKRTYKLVSPSGEIIITKILSDIIIIHNLDLSCLMRVASGKYKQHKGWRIEIL